MMRKEVADRAYRVFTYQDVDRVPDIQFGCWPQAIRRWLGEGMDLDLTEEETNDLFSAKIHRFFGFDAPLIWCLGLNPNMNPVFAEEVIERKAESVIMRDTSGVVAERYGNESDQSSIPRFIRLPIETPADTFTSIVAWATPAASTSTPAPKSPSSHSKRKAEPVVYARGFYKILDPRLTSGALEHPYDLARPNGQAHLESSPRF